MNTQDAASLLRSFGLLPKLYSGLELTVSFAAPGWSRSTPGICEALGLDLGASIHAYIEPRELPEAHMGLFASGESAKSLAAISKGSLVSAIVQTAWGTYEETDFTERGPRTEARDEYGLLLVEILKVDPAPEAAERE